MRKLLAMTPVLAALAGCGIPTGPCATITDLCSCNARLDCYAVSDGCICPSECGAQVQCVCGGGKFLRCDAVKK